MRTVLALVVLSLFTSYSTAQDAFNDEAQRAIRPGPYIPYGGANPVDRYRQNMYASPIWFGGYDSSEFATQRMLDRLDRQEKFGHMWKSAEKGSEFQVQRILNDYNQSQEAAQAPRRVTFSFGTFFGRTRR